jgi:hypothetical protein
LEALTTIKEIHPESTIIIKEAPNYGTSSRTNGYRRSFEKPCLKRWQNRDLPTLPSWGGPPGLDSVGINRREVVNERVIQEKE